LRKACGHRGEALHQALGHLLLAHLGPALDAVAGDEMDGVARPPHDLRRRADVVGDDEIAGFPGELGLGVLDEVLGLRGKADDDVGPVGAGGDGLEDVGVLGEFERRRGPSLLDLVARRLDAPVGHRGGEHGDVGGKLGRHRRQHVARRLDRHQLDAGRGLQLDRPRHQHGLGPEAGGGRGNGKALAARRAVGEIAHRVDGLARRPGRHQHLAAGQRPVSVTCGEVALDCAEDLGGLGHAAGAVFAARHVAVIGAHDGDAVLPQRGQVALRRRMLPHAHVHRRRHEHGRVGGQQRRGGEVGSKAGRHARQKIGGGRRHDDQVGGARQLDVAHLGLVGEAEQIGEHAFAAQARHRQRRHELFRRARHDAAHAEAHILSAPDQLQALVGRDAAADDEQDLLAVEHVSDLRGRKGALCQRRAARANSHD
jgi:hypothetical protein